MNAKEISLLSYKQTLEKLEEHECHLLLGNGFNMSLGVNTDYQSIFNKMTKNDHGIYKDAEKIVAESSHDLEMFIGKLIDDIKNKNIFLEKYIANKVKHDFMKAAHEIVKSEIKNVYAEKNEGIYMLLRNFTNYFTLNYDSFLYLLLLNFKSSSADAERTIAFQNSLKFMEKDINEVQNNIYAEIKKARENGTVSIFFANDSTSTFEDMSKLTKKNFISEIEIYSKNNGKNWKIKDIERVVKSILEEEKKNNILTKVDDGSKQLTLLDNTEYVFDVEKETQNLFFLHGAFHIYRDGEKEKKITQTTGKALYNRLEEIINNEEKDIICIFQSENKIGEINKSNYLGKSYNKLSKLSGVLVIIGCSLSKNDTHIYEQINISEVNTIYISSKEANKKEYYEKAKEFFSNKKIILFDRETISYELPDER